jgi:hypothetical protein
VPHYGGVDGAKERYARVLDRFSAEVGPDLDLVAALER